MPDYSGYAGNYPGSSGLTNTGAPLTILPNNPAYAAYNPGGGRLDYGVQQPDGTVVSILTGKPFSGREPRTGVTYNNGKPIGEASGQGVRVPFSNDVINPNNPNQRYQPVNITKQPDVAQGEQDLLKTFQDAAGSALKDFGSYLNTFKQGVGSAYKAGQDATNIGPVVNTLRGQQSSYAGALTGDQAAYANLNAQNAAAETGIVNQANAILPQYDAAAQNIGDRQLAAMMQQASRYKMGTGTPTSLGSADQQILARAVADVQLPLEEQKIGRQYDLLNNLALPVQRDIANRETARISQFNPATSAAIFSSGQGTEQAIQQLKQVTAGMSYQNAVQYMTSIGIPAQIQQQILTGEIASLGGLSNLENMSRYTGLQDRLGVYPSQPLGFSGGGPSYPGVSPRYPNTAGTGTLPTYGGGGAPITVGPAGSPQYPVATTGSSQYGPPPPGAYGLNAFGVPQFPGYAPAPGGVVQAPVYTGDVNLPDTTYG